MNGDILALSNLFFIEKDSALVFFFCLALVFLSVLLNFILCICKSEYTSLKRAWEIIFVGGINSVFLAVCLACSFGLSLFLLFFGVSLILISTTFCISTKRKPKKEELVNLARLIDKSAKDQNLSLQPTIAVEKVLCEQNDCSDKNEIETNKSCELDFEHVKNVIARLEYYSLSQADRRQVSELEGYIRSAEKGGMSEYFKSKINDGLGALLKLMSKYGF